MWRNRMVYEYSHWGKSQNSKSTLNKNQHFYPSLNPTAQITTTEVTLKNKNKHKIHLKSDTLTYANFI